MLDNIQNSIKTAISEKAEISLIYDSVNRKNYLNDFILFMKPEITSHIGFKSFTDILSDIIEIIESHHIKINQIHLLGSDYLSREHVFEEHYKAINDGAKDPLQFLTFKAQQTFKDLFGINLIDAHVLGGWEMLDRYPGLDAHQLDSIWQQSDFKKLDSGVYCSKIRFDSSETFIINGFAPKQIAYYTEDGSYILLFDLSSNLDWHFIRHDFCGTTMPSEAKQGSLRYFLFANQKRYDIEMSISKNGIHVSAGPIEALKEKMNFLRIESPDTIPFGKCLLQHFSLGDVNNILSNALLSIEDTVTSIFNLTENMNSDEVVDLLRKYQPFDWRVSDGGL